MQLSSVAAFRAVIAVLVATSVVGQVSASPPSYRFSSGDAALNIPVEVVADGLVFVRATVNEHPGWFILDNATQGFVVDRNYAQRIALLSNGGATAHGGGSDAINVGIVRDVKIGLPGLELTHRNLVVIDLKPLEPVVGHVIDGIIGSRLFDDFVVLVDYEHHLASVYLPDRYQPSENATAFPVRVDEHGFQFIDATIALPAVKPVTGSFLIDDGANSYADLYKPFSDAHQIPPPAMRLLDEPGTSTGGTTQSRDGRADLISIGPYSIKNPPITFAGDTEGLMASKDYAGLIGAEFLERFTVVFDSPGKRIWLTPNRTYPEPAAYDESGLRIHAEGAGLHKFVVRRIVPESPAAEAGIEPGDIIEYIDGHSAETMTLTEVRTTFCQSKARYLIGIIRRENHLRISLRPRPLL